jgi:hypothetical protein
MEVGALDCARFRALSNNPRDQTRNLCVLAVARALGVGEAEYLQTYEDLHSALHLGWILEIAEKPAETLPDLRARLRAAPLPPEARVVVCVFAHVLLLAPDGETIVDTAVGHTATRTEILEAVILRPKMQPSDVQPFHELGARSREPLTDGFR